MDKSRLKCAKTARSSFEREKIFHPYMSFLKHTFLLSLTISRGPPPLIDALRYMVKNSQWDSTFPRPSPHPKEPILLLGRVGGHGACLIRSPKTAFDIQFPSLEKWKGNFIALFSLEYLKVYNLLRRENSTMPPKKLCRCRVFLPPKLCRQKLCRVHKKLCRVFKNLCRLYKLCRLYIALLGVGAAVGMGVGVGVAVVMAVAVDKLRKLQY